MNTMFGDIIEPVNKLSAEVSALNNSLFRVSQLIETMITAINENTVEMQALRAAYENNKK